MLENLSFLVKIIDWRTNMTKKKRRESTIEAFLNYPKPTEESRVKSYRAFFEKAINFPRFCTNACIFIGKTKVNKIDLTYEMLKFYNLKEWDGKQGDYIFIDSVINNTSYKAALKLAKKYKDLKFVVVTNCNNIFQSDDLILLYKIISDDDRTITVISKRSVNNIKISAYYIFLYDDDITANLENIEKAKAFIECNEVINGEIHF